MIDTLGLKVRPGDTVRDKDGKLYTIDTNGSACCLDGISVVGFSSLIDPEIVERREQTVAKAEKLKATVKASRAKQSEDHFVRFTNLVRKTGRTQGQQRLICERNGITVVTEKRNGSSHAGINSTDVPRLVELCHQPDLIDNAREVAARQAKPIKIRPAEEAIKQAGNVQADGKAKEVVSMIHDALIAPGLEKYTDQLLADELRRRGYTISATKTVTIDL